MRIAIVTLLAALLVTAQGTRAQNAGPQLSGRVTEIGSGAPIAGATVTLEPPQIDGIPNFQSVQTDHEGYYRFMNIREGTYSIEVSAHGFVHSDYKTEGMPHGAFLRFDSSAHFKAIDIQLQPESIIRGSVTDNNGEPIAGVTVSAVQQSDAIKERLWPTSSARTDSTGRPRQDSIPIFALASAWLVTYPEMTPIFEFCMCSR